MKHGQPVVGTGRVPQYLELSILYNQRVAATRAVSLVLDNHALKHISRVFTVAFARVNAEAALSFRFGEQRAPQKIELILFFVGTNHPGKTLVLLYGFTVLTWVANISNFHNNQENLGRITGRVRL